MKNARSFKDVELIFNRVLEEGGGSYTLPTPLEAQSWRRRAYTFRTSLRKRKEADRANDIILVIQDETPCRVELILKEIRFDGVFIAKGSTEPEEFAATLNTGVNLRKTTDIPSDESFAEAVKLMETD